MPRPLTPPLPPCAVAAQSVPCSRRRGPVACSVVQVYSRSTMWSRQRGGLKPLRCGVEQLRCRRREREAALRKARREQQLVSKRLLRDEALEEAEEGCVAMIFGEAEIQQFLRLAQRGTEEKEREGALVSLRRGLQRPETQQTFIRLEGSIRTLVGLLTSNQALLQLEAARCLHELSHSEQSAVVEACLPATSYLLTYLSGHSSDFIELCLYTLGNLIVESEAVRRQLLPQGIVPALAACIQSPHLTVLEALGYALSQLLQAKEAPEKIIPSVLGSTLPQHMLQLLQPGPKLNLGVAVEFAWCLHYIICRSTMPCSSPRALCPPWGCCCWTWLGLSRELRMQDWSCSSSRNSPACFLRASGSLTTSLVLTVLCNVAEKGPAYCQRLWPGPLLSSLLDTLAFSDTEVVGQSLELLQLLFLYQPGAAQAFLQQSGLQALQRHEEVAQLQDRVHALQQTALHG
ncbi:transmembrane and coiled-coil domain-containing protein 6 isoform X5 [Balaenoptera musculus]|uniref:Transmembrane and coiled-coil domain-containing protein 6 isoform X5 n=1 Tax=Balaenoptera musculus TaxID=9771 RepID=A0A8B8X0J1_BALMU|nr:transmembrane and coiled-coil domain-containing protein 6 isoform X5 [Balaenoptera musculus]